MVESPFSPSVLLTQHKFARLSESIVAFCGSPRLECLVSLPASYNAQANVLPVCSSPTLANESLGCSSSEQASRIGKERGNRGSSEYAPTHTSVQVPFLGGEVILLVSFVGMQQRLDCSARCHWFNPFF
jgi:hypothetical protein